MKPLLIALKKDGSTTYVNSQDLRTVLIKRDGTIEITTSADLVRFESSSSQRDRLKRELRDRYKIVNVKTTGVDEEYSDGYQRRGKREKNRVLFVHQDDGDLQIIFPRGLKMATVLDDVVKLFTHVPHRGKPKSKCEASCTVKTDASPKNWLPFIHGIMGTAAAR